jgi:hypothetical protein
MWSQKAKLNGVPLRPARHEGVALGAGDERSASVRTSARKLD